MVTIYQDYGDEPRDVFSPLPEELACDFYALEMDGYSADIEFFQAILPKQGSLLELGCGTGRIAGRLSGHPAQDFRVTGIDISVAMLRRAAQRQGLPGRAPRYLCMDMVSMAFAVRFDAILIAYQTLNLLGSADRIGQCLDGCREILQPGGSLLVQLFVPTEDFIRQERNFQFQLFDRPGGGKIIKEILKRYEPQSRSVHIEERFRVRPMQDGAANEDWHVRYTIAGFSAEEWFILLRQAGFIPVRIYGDHTGGAYHRSTSSTLITLCTL